VAAFLGPSGAGCQADLLALAAHDFRKFVEAALRQLTFVIEGGRLGHRLRLRGHLIGPAAAIPRPAACLELPNRAHAPHHQARKATLAAMAEFIARVLAAV
jgi:hypothetical protein